MKYIIDTSAIIVLLEICCLENQLRKFSLNNELHVPPRVAEEFLEGAKIDSSVFATIFKVVNVDIEQTLLPYFNFESSSGEIWVISYALTHKDCCCIIDEAFSRKICQHFNVKLTGSIGLISEIRKQGLLTDDDLAKVRDKIKRSNFYLSGELLRKLDIICSSPKD